MTFPAQNQIDRPFAATRLKLRDFELIFLQLALIAILVWQFHLEEKLHLREALLLACGGFAVHAWLPVRFRRIWFILLSIGAILLVLGVEQAAYTLAAAALLIAVARLPVAFRWRIALLMVFAAVMVVWRTNWSAPFWPIVGSMFMFRMIVYMQHVRQERAPSTLVETCAYFFLFPNAFFPFFPVVDYGTFRETYYNEERCRIYQSGVHWLTVGVLHLLVYRLIRYELLPAPLEIRSAGDAALFLVMNYALYVRVSGLFHVICGMLHLFGYHLPRTHDAYFLASSFSDIWRRINIYWKDFMMKSFFFPAYFRARFIGGDRLGVALAVLWVFLWTWLGHSWQVFWLRGSFPLRIQDAALWLGVGTLVAANAVIDYRRAAGSAPAAGFSFVRAALHSLQVLGMFCAVTVFWAHWTNPDVLKMLLFSASVTPPSPEHLPAIFGALACATATGVIWQYMFRDGMRGPFAWIDGRRVSFEQSAGRHLLPLIGVLLVAQPPVYGLFGSEAAKLLAELQVDKVSRGQALAMIEGYYEDLNDNVLQSSPLLDDPSSNRTGQAVDFSDMLQRRNDLLEHELIPNWKGSWAGSTITINRWGMRDRDRTILRPDGTVRIALVGSSLVMGFGVGDDETFARLLENRLNAGADSSVPPYQVLNFGAGRCNPIHRRLVIKNKVLPFDPDVILYFAHQDELYTSAKRIATAVYHGMEIEDACLEDLIRAAGIRGGTSEALMQAAMERRHVEILRCLYQSIASDCRSAGIRLLYVYFPIPGDHDLPFDPRICLTIAREAGIETIDLNEWWGSRRPEDVLLEPADHHPNALGHQLVADALERVLRDRPALLRRDRSN